MRPIMLTTIVGLLFSASTAAQIDHPAYFVTMLGRDTIAVERYSLNGNTVKGTSVVRAPRTTVRMYEITFGPDRKLLRFHLTSQQLGAAGRGERDFVYSDDSVRVTSRQDTVTRTFSVAATGRPFPFFIDILAPWESALQQADQPPGKGEFGILAGRKVISYRVQKSPSGVLDLVNPSDDFGPLHATVGQNGTLEQLDMTETTDKFLARRVASIDVDAMARSFLERERSGNALGVLSPRDTARAEIGGAHILIDYGRPAARGRKIFGDVVPWGKVWRTGANAATQLITDKELTFGTTHIPAGTYSLFTLPSEQGWVLIINRQHGQWGTVYDASKDLARLPMVVKQRTEPVERFTFEIVPGQGGGTLLFAWETSEASVPFAVQ